MSLAVLQGIIVASIVLALVAFGIAFVAGRDAAAEARDASSGMRAAADGKIEAWLGGLIIRAGWRVTAQELGMAWGVALACAIAFMVVGPVDWRISLAVVVGVAVAPLLASMAAAHRNSRNFERQFGNAMPLIAADIKSGGTVMSALRAVTEIADDPLKGQLERFGARCDNGIKMSDSLEEMAKETKSMDVQILSTAVSVQQNHGGSIVGVIDQIGKTIAERQELRRMVQIKATSAVMTMRVVTIAAVLFVVVPAVFIEQGVAYYSQPIGWITAAVIAVMLIIANIVAKRQRDRIV